MCLLQMTKKFCDKRCPCKKEKRRKRKMMSYKTVNKTKGTECKLQVVCDSKLESNEKEDEKAEEEGNEIAGEGGEQRT